MSNELRQRLNALLASIGFNEGANKGFWRFQPREKVGEDAGQWIEMGAELRMFFKNKRGETASVVGRAVGSTGTPDGVRVLVKDKGGEGVPDGIYGANTANVRISEAIIPDEVLKEQGIDNIPKLGEEQEALLPKLEDMERADITDGDIRLINEGIDSKEAKEQAAYKKSIEDAEKAQAEEAPKSTSGTHLDSVIDELIRLQAENGQAISSPSEDKVKPTKPMNLNVGDVVADKNGENRATIIEIKLDPSSGGVSYMRIQKEDGTTGRVTLQLDKPVNVIPGAKGKPTKPEKPVKPVKPTPEKKPDPSPEPEPTPDPEPTPEPTPKPTQSGTPRQLEELQDLVDRGITDKKLSKEIGDFLNKYGSLDASEMDGAELDKLIEKGRAHFSAKRKDDGSDVVPTKLTTQELRAKKIRNVIDALTGKLLKVKTNSGKSSRTIEDPNAIIDALLEVNPSAKIKDDGAIVMERGTFTDTDGRSYKYEVAVERTVGNQFMERYTISDPETGEVIHDFYNHDYKDSFYGLYGKTNGLEKTRDQLLGRDVPGLKGVDKNGVPIDKELRNYFGPDKNLEQRLKYLRKTKDMGNWRLITPEENREKFLSGRDRKLNKSDTDFNKQYRNQFGNVLRSFLPDIYKAIKDGDEQSVKEILVQTLGRLPDNQKAKDDLILTLAAGIDARFKGTPDYDRVKQLPRTLNRWLLQENLDIRDGDKIPFVSEDGVGTVKIGDVVRFVNNEGDFAIGTVVKLVPASGKNGNYKDTARVQFENQIVDNLQTRNMQILDPEDPDSKPTDYAPWVRLDEKIRRRADELGIDFETWRRRKEDNPEYDPDGKEAAIENAGAARELADVAAGIANRVEKMKSRFGKVEQNPDNTLLNGRGSRALGNASSIPVNVPNKQDIESLLNSRDETLQTETLVKTKDGTGVIVKPTEEARQKKNEILAAGAAFYESIQEKLDNVEKERQTALDQAVDSVMPLEKVNELEQKSIQSMEAKDKASDEFYAYVDQRIEEDPSLGGTTSFLKRDTAVGKLLDQQDPRMLELNEAAIAANNKHLEDRKAFWDAQSARDKAISEASKNLGSASVARRKAIKEALTEAGVQLDTVKVADFGDRFSFRSTSSDIKVPALKAELDEVFEYMPKPVLEALLESGAKIEFAGRASRGNMSTIGPDVDGNSRYAVNTNSRDGSTFEVTLHEMWHVIQAENPDLIPMEHAFLYDRLVDSEGNIPGVRTVFGYSNSREKMILSGNEDPFASHYAQKFYRSTMDQGALLSGSTGHTEVSTVLMQGLFAAPRLLRGGNDGTTGKLLMKYGKETRSLDIGVDVYYNPADGKYYRDSAFSIPVNPSDIAGYAGKMAGQEDTTSMHFALGLLIGYGKSNG